MSLSNFSRMLEAWGRHADGERAKIKKEISYFASDEIKLRALAEVYQMPFDHVVSSLLHQAILEVEEKMPYVAGDKVIRIEESAEIYEDVGPMARYLQAQQQLKGE
jgi:hypothetical protein